MDDPGPGRPGDRRCSGHVRDAAGRSSILNRRQFLGSVAALGFGAATGVPSAQALRARFEVTRSDAQWRRLLSPRQYAVLRAGATERPRSSPLDRERRRGTYRCAGCALPLFSSRTKFESGTGWPSFFAPLAGSVGLRADRSLGEARTEVHCRRCGGHLGHVFDDGPRPTGKRYCMNGIAMTFTAA